jgi:hypothetical protein
MNIVIYNMYFSRVLGKCIYDYQYYRILIYI